MYKLTEYGSKVPIYDSTNNPLPEGAVFFSAHPILWKDGISLGVVNIYKQVIKLAFFPPAITIEREKFQELFMRDAPIVELIFNANEVKKAELVLANVKTHSTSRKKSPSVELYDYDNDKLYAYLHYWLKK